MNNTTISLTTTIPPIKTNIQVLKYDDNGRLIFENVMLFSHYIMLLCPFLILCWYGLIRYLKNRGHITTKEAESMIEELKSIPKRSPIITTNGRRFNTANYMV